jgi:hypothetical protein
MEHHGDRRVKINLQDGLVCLPMWYPKKDAHAIGTGCRLRTLFPMSLGETRKEEPFIFQIRRCNSVSNQGSDSIISNRTRAAKVSLKLHVHTVPHTSSFIT